MIITRTPFRISFAGGGSDLRDFYCKNGFGSVVSTTINKYMYIVIHPYFHDKIRIKYSKTEDVRNIEDIQHPIVRECLKKVQIDSGIEIASFADVPAGTGLGSSSAFTVGLLNALYAYKGKIVSKENLAAQACEIEIEILKEPIGKQDQYAVAYGNVNCIKFNKDETVEVSPIILDESSRKDLGNKLCLYYIGGKRRAGDILSEQKTNMSDADKFQNLQMMVKLAEELYVKLTDEGIRCLGDLLHKGWILKKELASGISNQEIDALYEKALGSGAAGGKLLGAGGNGFLLLYSDDHSKMQDSFGCRALPFEIDKEGSKIIYYE